MRDLMKSLAGCKDVAGLRSTILELCSGFNEISHFDVMALSRSGKHQALCFLRLDSAAQEQQLMASLGASRFGKDLLLVVDLPVETMNTAGQREGFRPRSNEPRRRSSDARRVLDRRIGWPDKGLVR